MLGEKQHTVLFFKTLAPLRYPLEKAWFVRGFGTARHPRGSNATEGSCAAHILVGVGAYDDPRSWESNFTYERSQRLLRRSLRAKALGFVRSAMLHFQNFVSLALAQDDVLRGVRGGLMLRNTVFIQTSVPSSTTQSAVPLPLRGRLVLCPPTQVGA